MFQDPQADRNPQNKKNFCIIRETRSGYRILKRIESPITTRIHTILSDMHDQLQDPQADRKPYNKEKHIIRDVYTGSYRILRRIEAPITALLASCERWISKTFRILKRIEAPRTSLKKATTKSFCCSFSILERIEAPRTQIKASGQWNKTDTFQHPRTDRSPQNFVTLVMMVPPPSSFSILERIEAPRIDTFVATYPHRLYHRDRAKAVFWPFNSPFCSYQSLAFPSIDDLIRRSIFVPKEEIFESGRFHGHFWVERQNEGFILSLYQSQ